MPRKINADVALEEIRRRRKIARRKAGLQNKLSRYRSSLVELRRAGASYRDLVFWLRINHRLSADHTTVMRYMKSLPEMAAHVSHSSTAPLTRFVCHQENLKVSYVPRRPSQHPVSES